MPIPQIEKTLTALAGEFLVAGQLCVKKYLASLTLKNYPKVDIFCLNPRTQKQVSIQVKTKRGGNAYYVPEDIAPTDPPFVFVYIHANENVDYYIMPAKDVAAFSTKERDDYVRSHPNSKKEQPRMLSVKNIDDRKYRNRWDLLGLD